MEIRPIFRESPATSSALAHSPLLPTPDYGSLGPGSDVATHAGDGAAGGPGQSARPRLGPLVAIALGGLLAGLWLNAGRARDNWERLARSLSSLGKQTALASTNDGTRWDRQNPQKQAETLLARAVANSDGVAADQIASHADNWRGKLQWNSQLATLTTAALNSSDLRVRQSGIEVQLSAYGLGKSPSSIDLLARNADLTDHARKIWALWALGGMGNRGVETERVVQVLSTHLNDPDEDSRRWAVEGLALVGTTPTIDLLLRTMHDDHSALVRERAACSLAESGMLSHEQRLTAVPALLDYTDDPALDAQTRAWAFQALADITRQRLPNDSSAWRNWYAGSGAGK